MKGYIAQRTLGTPNRLTAVRYTGALLAVVVGVLLGLWAQPVVDATVLLLMAVLIAAWFSGLWPALLASVLATLALDYFFTPPLYTLTLELAHLPHLVVFALIAALFASASAGRRSAERSLKQARNELDAKVRARTSELTRANHRLATQYAMTRALAESDSLQAAAPEVLQIVGHTMDWEWGALWTVDSDARVLRCASTWCAPGLEAPDFGGPDLTFTSGRGLPGHVWETGLPDWIPDVAQDPGFVRTAIAAKAGFHGAVAFPILVRNETTGAMEFFSRSVRHPDQDELETLAAVGSQIGQFIERRRAEEQREQLLIRERAAHAEAIAAQQRFQDLVNSIEGIVWEADARTFQFTFVSKQAERVLGYPLEQWITNPTFWKDHIHADDRESAVAECVTATAQKRDRDFEYRMVSADGRHVWLRDLVSVVVEGDQATRLRGVMFDITARKQAEQALREQAELLNLTHDTIFVRDMSDVIRYWNRGAEELYGWTSDEAVGRVSHELMQTIFPAPLGHITAQVVQEGRWEGELLHIRRDGSQVVAASRWSLLRDADGLPVAILETNNDITERTRAEDKLRRSEASLAEAQRLSHMGSWVEDLVAGTFTASPELRRIMDYPDTDAVTPEMLRQRVHPEDLARIEDAAARSRRDKTDFDFEHRIVLSDGSIRYVHTIGHPVVNAAGHPVEIVGTVADVTERKRAEDALRASEEQWKAVFENNPTMYFMVDALGTVLSVNPFGADQLGYAVDELIGQSVLKVFAQTDWDTVRQTIEACLDHLDQVMSWEIRKVRRDGTVIWVRETAKAMRRINASPVVLIACEDITLRKRTEADLRESERRHRHIFHATGVSIWEEDFSAVKAAIDDLKQSGIHDLREHLRSSPDFIDHAISLVRTVDVNEATLKLFGATGKEELLGSLHKVFTPDTRDVFAGELIAIAEGQTSFEGETILKKLNGESMVVLFSVSFPPPDAAFDAVLVSIIDITDRKRAEQELEELAGRLIHAQEQERSRIGRELHDHISQMLGVLTIRMDQLRADDGTPAAVAAGLEELRQSASEITDDIHGLSHRLHSSALDYLGLVPALQKLVNEFAARHSIAIDFEHVALPAPLPSEVALCLFRVTEESLTNIAKHSQAKSARVHVSGAPDGIHLSVEDYGRGFDFGSLERKAGLGFVSMRERLRVLRGTVRVGSAPSRGTRIDVWVPAASLVPVTTSEAAHGASPPARAPSNVSSA
jgi:PAS domain S-box-containing protein